jgi:hypothetical protein
MTFLRSNLPFTSKISTKSLGNGHTLLASMQRHSWHLSEQLVLLSISEDDIEEMLKSDMRNWLLTYEVPVQFRIGKPELPVI